MSLDLPAIAAEEPEPDAPRARYWWAEPLALVILATASVMTAWSAYQSARWSGIMALEQGRAASLRAQAIDADSTAGQLLIIDVQGFVAWSSAIAYGDIPQAVFFRERFRAEFLTAFDAWLQRPPGTTTSPDQIPPGTPFDTYRPALFEEADVLAAQADEALVTAHESNRRGDNYVLTTVLLALVLFFAALGPRFKSHRLGAVLTVMAGVTAIFAFLVLLVQPISIEI